jgi:hypothetical protein
MPLAKYNATEMLAMSCLNGSSLLHGKVYNLQGATSLAMSCLFDSSLLREESSLLPSYKFII